MAVLVETPTLRRHCDASFSAVAVLVVAVLVETSALVDKVDLPGQAITTRLFLVLFLFCCVAVPVETPTFWRH